jgi:hypothetical protein
MKYNEISYSNNKLKNLCKNPNFFQKGFSPWIRWESESSSLGKTFRSYGFYPSFLSLFINSDHAVHAESKVWPNEINSKFPHITWNFRKYKKLLKLKKKTFYVQHPWIFYKEKINFLKKDKKGTIFFFPHSGQSSEPIIRNLDKFILEIISIPKKYHPITICLLFTDIEKKIHIKLRKYKMPLITAGHMNNINFVDNFYKMISLFKYAAAPKSNLIGSSFFYCMDFGIPYFFIGKKELKYMNLGSFLKDKAIKTSSFYDGEDRKKINFFKKKFNKPYELLSKKDQYLVTEFLGKNSSINRLQFSMILWKNFFFNIPFFLIIVLKVIIKVFIRIFFLTIKKSPI